MIKRALPELNVFFTGLSAYLPEPINTNFKCRNKKLSLRIGCAMRIMRTESLIALTLCATLAIFSINVVPLSNAELTSSYSFIDFVQEIFGNVPNATAYRYDAKDNQGYGLDTIKIIENPLGGYLGVYHFNVNGIFQVRLANSTDLLYWTYDRTIEDYASQPTISEAQNGAYIVAFEKHVFTGSREERHVGFHYYPNLTSLLTGTGYYRLITNLTVAVQLEGTPNIYNITVKDSTMKVCVGFHYNDASGLDRVAVGHLTIPLDNPTFMVWNSTRPQSEYNQKLLQTDPNIKGHIGDRDYGQIFGRNFTFQEAQYVKDDASTWSIFLYDHLSGNFVKLDIRTHKGSISFANPTFTMLKSPNKKDCIVITYFLHTYKNAAQPGEGGELIFYKEFESYPFNLSFNDKQHPLYVTSNSTISNPPYINNTERSINFNVSGLDNTRGYCIIKLPNNLTQDLWRGNYTVLIDNKPCPFENWTDTENTYIYINYQYTEHKITIIPELSTLMLAILIITVSAVFIARTLFNRNNSFRHSISSPYF